jgi:putative ABC transport system permease protein
VLNPSWQIAGSWIDDSATVETEKYCLAGKSLAASLHLAPGDAVSLAVGESESQPQAGGETPIQIQCAIRGILTTGGAEDNQIFTTLAVAQSLAGLPGKTRKIQASALIKPEDDKSRRDPKAMTPAEYERWYCSPYISSILHQIDEVLPGASARQISPVAETEGKVLGKLEFLMATLAVLALVAAALSISSIATIRVVKRRQEISLMKAIGAEDRLVSMLFLAEAALQGIVGGAFGFGGGLLLARLIERLVFGGQLAVNWLLLPVVVLTGLLVSFAGTWGPLKVAQSYEPATILRGE